jgi:hypothetical protein
MKYELKNNTQMTARAVETQCIASLQRRDAVGALHAMPPQRSSRTSAGTHGLQIRASDERVWNVTSNRLIQGFQPLTGVKTLLGGAKRSSDAVETQCIASLQCTTSLQQINNNRNKNNI